MTDGWPDDWPKVAPRVALRQAAWSVRRTIQELLTTDADDATIDEAARLMARAADLLAGHPHGRPYEGAAEASLGGDEAWSFELSPLVGLANPLAPPIRLTVEEQGVTGRVVFGSAYEGPPGCVHGGFIAAGFDEVLGFAQSSSGRPGMTGRLVIHYRQPTPLHRELVYRGRIERIDGRKISTRGDLHAGSTLTAEAEALFISIDPSVFAGRLARKPGDGRPG